MEQLQRVLAEIRTYLGKLSVTQRLLIAMTVVIAAMSLFLVTQYAAGPSMVSLAGYAPENLSGVEVTLAAAGIDATVRDGSVMVPEKSRNRALAVLAESGELPDDTTILFDNLIGKQDWRHSREQHRQQYIFALQNELGRVISRFRGVESATVIIDAPERQGLGRSARDPSASVTVFPAGGRPLDQNTVDAVASLVAGARSGLSIESVKVIDGVTRQQRRATDDGLMLAGTYLDQRGKVETDTRRKLESLLSYIPGVIVAVSAQVDVTRVSEQTRAHLDKGQGTISLIKSESTQSVSQSGGASGAEPGVRSMQGADINQASSSTGSGSQADETDTTFENAIGTTLRDVIDPRGMPTFLAASVNVPEEYVVELIRLESPPADGAEPENPTPQAIRARFDEIRAQIAASVRPHLKAVASTGDPIEGEVEVAMIPTKVLAAASAGTGGGGLMGLINGGGSGGGLVGGGVVDTALLGGLAVVSLAMMVMMVRRSSKRVELPTPEELVGVPPVLENEDDIVGEAEETEGAMAGIEIGESDVERNKMLSQIAELINSEPGKAANLLNRWMATTE